MNKNELTHDQLCIDATMRLYNSIRKLLSKQINAKKMTNAARIYVILIALKMTEVDFVSFIKELNAIPEEALKEIKKDADEKAMTLLNIILKKDIKPS